MSLSFEDALRGVTVKVPVDKANACPTCHGSGAAPGTSPTICPVCKGRGVTSESQGFFSINQPCERCGGAGTVIENPCPTCHGSGRVRSTKTYQVRIPAGVRDGTRIKVKGKGEAAPRGGEPGDLYVVTRVTASPLFTRNGDDLVIDVPVTFAEAAMGEQVELPTPDGATVRVKVPAGSTDGKTLRVKGRGAPRLNGGGHGRPARPPADRGAVEARRSRSARRSSGCRRSSRRTTATRARSCSRRRPPGECMQALPTTIPATRSRSRPSSPACIPRRCARTRRRASCGRGGRPAAPAATPTATSSGCARSARSPASWA